MTDRIRCAVCGQDYLRRYANTRTREEFLLCPECESVWLPGEDTAQWAQHDLADLFPGFQYLPVDEDWDFMELVETDER